MKAKKSLGQNFLTSKRVVSAMRDAGDPTPLDIILEIGPGKGILTEMLLFFAGKVIAIEKDRELCVLLREKFSKEISEGKLDLIEGDIMEFDPNVLKFYKDLNYKLIANIPYNITGAILKKFLSADYQPELMVVLVQKEVAQRITAQDGKESILSMSVKAYGVPKIIQKVSRKLFNPEPNVDSTVILISNISKSFFKDFSEEAFFAWVRSGFAHKRKLLIRNLEKVSNIKELQEVFSRLSINRNVRAEDLTLLDWKKLLLGIKTNH